MPAAGLKPRKLNRIAAREAGIKCVIVSPIHLELRARTVFKINSYGSAAVRCINVSVTAIGALVSLDAVQSARRRIQCPVVAFVLHHIPLAGAVPVLVGVTSFLACGQPRP